MRNIFLFVIITAVVLFSCSNGKKEARLEKADSLLQVISVIDSTVAAYDTDTAQNRYSKMKEDIDFLGKYLTTLPEDRSTGTSLSEYANSSKGFKRFFKDLGGIVTENALSKRQLENLKKDISDNAISDAETALYIVEEEKAVSQTFQKMKESVEKYNSLCKKTSGLKATVQLVIDSLKKVNKIQ